MAIAYVLINCDLGTEEEVIEELKHLSDVKEVHGTFGAYDILAKIESPTAESLRETITWKIRKNGQDKVNSNPYDSRGSVVREIKNLKNPHFFPFFKITFDTNCK